MHGIAAINVGILIAKYKLTRILPKNYSKCMPVKVRQFCRGVSNFGRDLQNTRLFFLNTLLAKGLEKFCDLSGCIQSYIGVFRNP
jgi:hypothetical protein